METLELLKNPQVLGASWAMFSSGFPAALGPMARAIEDLGTREAYVEAAGWKMLAMKVSMVLAGFFYDRFPSRLRMLTIVSYVLFLGLAIIGLGVGLSSSLVVYLGNLLTGVGMGFLYLLGIMFATTAAPDHPGITLGITMTAYVLGTIFGTEMLVFFSEIMSLSKCLYIAALGLSAVGILSASPPNSDSDLEKKAVERAAEAPEESQQVHLLLKPELYAFICVVGIAQGPAWAIMDSFDGIASSVFGFSLRESDVLFSAINAFSLVLRLTSGVIAELLGTDFVTLGCMAILGLSALAMHYGVFYQQKQIVVAGLFMHWIPMTLVATIAPLVAKRVFGKKNTATAFSIAKGGSGFFILVLSLITSEAALAPPTQRVSKFIWYCNIVLLSSILGVLFVLAIRSLSSRPKRSSLSWEEERPLLSAEDFREDLNSIAIPQSPQKDLVRRRSIVNP